MRSQALLSFALVGVFGLFACNQSDPSLETDEPATSDDAIVSGVQSPFLGAWSLTRIERRSAEGELVAEPIENRLGYLIYDASGHMGVTLMQPDRQPYQGDEPTADEALALLGSYTSYFGRFSVNEEEGFVTHHLEGSLNPDGAGSDYQRFFRFGENSLTLQPPAADDGSKAFLTWERLPDLAVDVLTETHQQLFGAYRVESVTRYTEDGTSLDADQYETAFIFYSPSGHMSVHLMRPGRIPYAGERPSAAEALLATETYGSYFGPFSVNEIAGCITCPGPRDGGYLVHHRVGNENPGGSGTDARRYFELTDTHLTLRPPPRSDDEGRSVQTAIRWARLTE